MNIFVLHYDPRKCARAYCDIHLTRLTMDIAILLCSSYPPNHAPYKRRYYEHPCAKWTRASLTNYRWLCQLGIELCREYYHRFNRPHKSQAVIEWCHQHAGWVYMPETSTLTDFPIVVSNDCRVSEDVVKCYQEYYRKKNKQMKFVYTKRKKPRFLYS